MKIIDFCFADEKNSRDKFSEQYEHLKLIKEQLDCSSLQQTCRGHNFECKYFIKVYTKYDICCSTGMPGVEIPIFIGMKDRDTSIRPRGDPAVLNTFIMTECHQVMSSLVQGN